MRIVFFFLCMSIASVSTCWGQWKQKKFIIGTFADPRLSTPSDRIKDSISFKLAADAGFNLLSGPQFYTGGRDFSMMNRTLDLAYEFGFKLLVIDHRFNVISDQFTKEQADTVLDYFKSVSPQRRSALYGYYFGGEFPLKYSDKVADWVAYFKSKDPEKLPYYYLLPIIAFQSNSKYQLYVDTYLNNKDVNKRPEVVSYDYYPFQKGGTIRNNYFYNLKLMSDNAGIRPFWYYVLTTQHGNYPEPDAYQLAFSAFSPIAYGAKGLLYFSYETIPKRYGGDYKDAIISANGKPTFKYDIVKRINNYINNSIGPIVMSSRYIGTYHVSSQPTGEVLSNKQLVSRNTPFIKSISDPNILVGIFKSNVDNTVNYIFVVNKSNRQLKEVKISLKGNYMNRLFSNQGFSEHSVNLNSVKLDTKFSTKNSTDFYISLSPGEGKMVELKSPI